MLISFHQADHRGRKATLNTVQRARTPMLNSSVYLFSLPHESSSQLTMASQSFLGLSGWWVGQRRSLFPLKYIRFTLAGARCGVATQTCLRTLFTLPWRKAWTLTYTHNTVCNVGKWTNLLEPIHEPQLNPCRAVILNKYSQKLLGRHCVSHFYTCLSLHLKMVLPHNYYCPIL